MCDWISVKDRNPNEDEQSGFTYDGISINTRQWFNHKNNCWMDWSSEVNKPVTHWMLVPPPPSEI